MAGAGWWRVRQLRAGPEAGGAFTRGVRTWARVTLRSRQLPCRPAQRLAPAAILHFPCSGKHLFPPLANRIFSCRRVASPVAPRRRMDEISPAMSCHFALAPAVERSALADYKKINIINLLEHHQSFSELDRFMQNRRQAGHDTIDPQQPTGSPGRTEIRPICRQHNHLKRRRKQ